METSDKGIMVSSLIVLLYCVYLLMACFQSSTPIAAATNASSNCDGKNFPQLCVCVCARACVRVCSMPSCNAGESPIFGILDNVVPLAFRLEQHLES